MAHKTLHLRIKGMTCQGCADGIRLALKRQKGVQEVRIDLKSTRGVVVFDPDLASEEAVLANRVFRAPYSVERAEESGA